jgi:hypothetical protein
LEGSGIHQKAAGFIHEAEWIAVFKDVKSLRMGDSETTAAHGAYRAGAKNSSTNFIIQ